MKKPTRAKKKVVRRRRGVSKVQVVTIGAGGAGGAGGGGGGGEYHGIKFAPDTRPFSGYDHTRLWRTRDGQVLRFTEMQHDHLINARNLLRRKIEKMVDAERAMSREVLRRLVAADTAVFGPFSKVVQEAVSDPSGKFAAAWEDWPETGSL